MALSGPALRLLSEQLVAHEDCGGLDSARTREQRRQLGAFFTPQPLVEFAVEEALDAYCERCDLEWQPDGAPRLRILDPSAGDGRFLLACAASLARRGGSKASLAAILSKCTIAIERDPQYAELLSQTIGEVHCCEALLSGVVADGSVDLVVGNPPYLRSIYLGQSDEALRSKLRGVFAATSHGEWDVYAAFLEQGLAWLVPGGELALVLPSRWWTAQWAAPLRARLAESANVRALVDFGAVQVFADATVYSSLCFASATRHAAVRVARVRDQGWQLGEVQTPELSEAPWELAVGAARALVDALKAAGPRLGEVAQVCKGAGTNADSVFVVVAPDAAIEEAIMRPVLRGRDVLAYGHTDGWPRVIVPYDESGRLIAPDRMRGEFPMAYAHLLQHRQLLEARERGRFAGDRFYRYGRPQNMAFHSSAEAKLVVPDVTKQGRAMIDRQRAMVLDSAYALRAKDDAVGLDELCGILNSRVVRLWLEQQGMTLRGGYTRMKTAFLKQLPVPRPGQALRAIGDAVRDGGGAASIDELVRRAYGISTQAWFDS